MNIYQIKTSGWTSGSSTKTAAVVLELLVYPATSSAKIDWKLRLQSGYNSIVVGELKLIFGRTTIYYRAPDQKKEATNNQILAQGTTNVEIEGASAPLDIYVGAGIYEWAINVSATETIDLVASQQLCTADFKAGTVGEEHRIWISGTYGWIDYADEYGLVQKCNLRYKFGNYEGVIAEGLTDETYIDWIIPTDLFNLYPTQTTATGVIYCDTYSLDGKTNRGTTQKSFLIYIKDGPKLSPTVEDVDPTTLALTGDKNKIVRFFSDAKYVFNATPGEGTALDKYHIECGDEKITRYSTETNPGEGTLEDVEVATFKFSVTDRRNYTGTKTVEKELIPYVKLTCNIWRIEATGDGTIKVGIGGDIFSASFGAVRNTLRISYRVKEGNGEFGEWQSIDYLNDDATYEVTVTLNDLDYSKTYTFEAMAEDKLMTVVSRQLPVRAIPVYDWGRDDFNVNVPFNMNHTTVLRHNHLANNVVLSASGGFIYFRPGGTDDTSAEVKINPQGNIELTGDIIINGQSLKSLLGI